MISGQIVGGRFVKTLGFPWLMRTAGIINVSYCCLLVFLSKVSDNKKDKVYIKCYKTKNNNTRVKGNG